MEALILQADLMLLSVDWSSGAGPVVVQGTVPNNLRIRDKPYTK